MAHKRAGGSVKNGRDSKSKRLGIKFYKNNKVIPGNIIVRQRGTKWKPGKGTFLGKDYTILARSSGTILFKRINRRKSMVSIV
ncbi:MAG: 50S ribosomal protein L27 [Candidatus Hodgkinia cicadicola]